MKYDTLTHERIRDVLRKLETNRRRRTRDPCSVPYLFGRAETCKLLGTGWMPDRGIRDNWSDSVNEPPSDYGSKTPPDAARLQDLAFR